MSVKVTSSEARMPPPKPTYPYVGVSKSGVMVLFNKEKTGTVIKPDGFFNLGFYSVQWEEIEFTRYKGTVTLECDR